MLKIFAAFLCFVLLQTQLCFSSETILKHYVTPDQIKISPEGISIFLESGCLNVDSIFQDKRGFYYLEEGVYWICNSCGAFNELGETSCYRCHES